MDQPLIPESYWISLRNHFGEAVEQKVKAGLQQAASVSVRKHLHKQSNIETAENIVWCENGFLLKERPVFALDPNFHAGSYYVQDSSSMILREALNQLKLETDEPMMLDACAAPGGKSTLILDYLDGRGFLISNEIDGKRNDILEENLTKWGYANQAITKLDTYHFEELTSFFDLVVLDAPCSGEGMFRKDAFAVSQWSESLIQQCNLTQQTIVSNLTPALKSGGYLIYCTCTTNLTENEHQIQSLVDSGDYELTNPDFSKFSEYILPAELNGKLLGFYLLPGISTGEGQFISVLRKVTNHGELSISRKRRLALSRTKIDTSDFGINHDFAAFWQSGNEYFGVNGCNDKLEQLSDRFHFRSVGLGLVEIDGKKRIPMHGLAMDFRTADFVELNLEEALAFLRKDAISAQNFEHEGWQLVGYQNQPLGWVKALGNRVNNYYPNKYKLRLK